MNFLQLVNRTRQECAASGADLTTVVGQSGESLNFINWVNAAWMDIQTMHTDWEWMRKSMAFPTVTSQPIYTTTQIGLTDFGHWARDTFRNYANPIVMMTIASPCVVTLQGYGLSIGDTVTFLTTGALPTGVTALITYYVVSTPTANTFTFSATSGGSAINASGTQSGTQTMTTNNTVLFAGFNSEIFMEYIDYDAWRNSYEYGALRQIQTRPLNITITPNKSIGLGPFPIVGYTVVGDYYSVPTEMSANLDIPALPDKFHLAIVYRAMTSYGFYESAPEVYGRGEKEYSKWIRRIMAERLSEITASGPLC